MSAAPSLYSRDAFVELPPAVTTHAVAEGCRSVALSFMNGLGSGWGKREVAEWLSGAYRNITRYARQSGNVLPFVPLVHQDTSKNAPLLDNATLSPILRETHARVILALSPAFATAFERDAPPSSKHGGFVGVALAHNLAVPCIDRTNMVGWAPVDVSAAKLHDRVLALFAVDKLRNPDLYRSAFAVCPECQRITFDAEQRRRGGACLEHALDGATSGERPIVAAHVGIATAPPGPLGRRDARQGTRAPSVPPPPASTRGRDASAKYASVREALARPTPAPSPSSNPTSSPPQMPAALKQTLIGMGAFGRR